MTEATNNKPSENSDKSQNNKHQKKVLKQDEKLVRDQEERYTEGEELQFVRVRFPGNAKSQPFLLGSRNFVYGQKVIAMSDRGMTVGYVNSFPYTVTFDKSMLPIRTISKVATPEDIEEQKNFLQKENDAEVLCIRLIAKHNLNMNLTHVEFIQFGKKAVFYFTAPERVDFRNLVKDLVSDLKMRIELRQISVRDRAAALGAIGACGLQTCCSSFLTNYGNASIKMAKNQNLALIPAKINGVCGQVKCCMKYEDDVYSQKRKFLPLEQTFIKVKNGDVGKVIKLHLLIEQFEMLTDKGQIRRYAKNQFDAKKSFPPKEWRFPREFRSIISETSTVIGLAELEEEQRENSLENDGLGKRTQISVERTVEAKDKAEAKTEEKPEVSAKDNKSSENKESEGDRPQTNRNRNNRNRNRNRNRRPQNKNQKEQGSTETKTDGAPRPAKKSYRRNKKPQGEGQSPKKSE
ncbi:MAG: hypothetical protein BM556_11890 [Bacteriovorax sp. MedPE-SWde]|nr:MAG: hypothetical protein BM556_11890 [Bacteriovorax sp. MedPE-SWde]